MLNCLSCPFAPLENSSLCLGLWHFYEALIIVAIFLYVKPMGIVHIELLFKKSNLIPSSMTSGSFKFKILLDVSQLAAPQKAFYEALVL